MPEIIVTNGDIFASGCYALVSPVDAATGAQGKGLALEFKRRWPERCAEYRRACLAGHVGPGDVTMDEHGVPVIMFAATKRHWADRSEIRWIQWCMDGIDRRVRIARTESIAIPALGCGLGSLSWADVRPLMLDAAARMQCDVVKIYEPR